MQLVNLVFCVISLMLLAGCGGSSSTGSPHAVSTAAASATCLDCHATAVSPGTGALIAAEWGASTHNLNNGASCADCHEPPANHPNNACSACHGGGTGEVTQNPDAAGKCLKCHGPAHPSDIMMVKAPQHYGYSSATVQGQAKRASFVSGRYVGDCRACHNPHLNTVTPQHRAWAASAHGDPKGVAWSSNDFTTANRALCSRCHTATGYISYVTSNFTVPSTAAGTGDGSRQLLACNACHTSYDFKKIRQVASFTAPYKGYNGSDLAGFPSVGETNLCIPCHTGRESGHSLDAVTNFASANFINPHYLAAAGLMYMQSGFTGFTSASAVIGSSTYGKSLSPDSISTPGGLSGGTTSTHRNLGTTRINNDSHKPSFFVPGVADSNGPCVTCHLNASGVAVRAANGHSLKIDDNAYNQLCTNCHSSENTVPLNAANFRSVFLEPQAEAFQSTLALAVYLLKQPKYNIEYDPALYPYFFVGGQPHSSTTAVKDWTLGGTVNGKKLMGACFNIQLLTKDPAAFAHARSYSRRLLYDSIDFIDDGIMNRSAGNTAQTASAQGDALSNPVFGKFTKGAKAYDSAFDSTTNGVTKYVITTIASGTSEAMLYLVGWSRSGSDADPATAAAKAGAWNSPERP